jgi:excisionase family DNA binding protein
MIENPKEVEKLLRGYLTTGKVAEKLNISRERVRQLVVQKKLPALLIGGIYFIDPKDLKLVKDRGKPGPKKKIINLREPD